MQGFLGSIDANTGDTLVGWDTDQFPTNIYLTTQIMHSILKYGGLAPGGVNFDAKVRRESFEPVDLFHAHIGGMDAFARGLKIAAAIRADGALQKLVEERYASWSSQLGKRVESGSETLKSLEQEMLTKGEAEPCKSGRQELFENLINTYL
jgi:xylose isomerase